MWHDAFDELRGRRVLVTGASSGIGAAVAKAFADCGANVALHYASNAEAAASLVAAITVAGGSAVALHADLGEAGAGVALARTAIERLGGIDVLVNNAGAALARVPFDEFDDATRRRIVQLNQLSVLESIRVVLPVMRDQRRGSIISTTSIAARNGGGAGVSLYAAAKGALESVTRSLAREEGVHGIRVNCVSPGYIDTPIHRVTSDEQRRRYIEATPLHRAGRPDDCAGLYLFLACERLSGFITGQTIGVNGGMHLN